MRTVAIVNQKGGCGKTTTAINLAGVLARFGEPTLLVDLDPQSHCSAGLAIPEDCIDLNIGDAMLAGDGAGVDETRLLWRVRKNFDLAPSTMKLAGLEAARGGLSDVDEPDIRLKRALDHWSSRYSMCLIDCPPSIGLLTYNALRAADEVLIPVETGFFSLQGAGRQINTIRSLAHRLGSDTPFRLIATMHDENSSLAQELLAELKRRFGDHVAPTLIRLDPKLKDAVSMGQPIIEYAPSSKGSQDYSDLAAWLLGRSAPIFDDAPASEEITRPSRPAGGRRPRAQPQPLAEALAPATSGTAVSAVVQSFVTGEAPVPQAPIPSTPALCESSEPAEDPLMSRAAELAIRARQLLRKGAALQAKLRSDPDVAKAMGRTAPERTGRAEPVEAPTPGDRILDCQQLEELFHPITGPIETSQGVVFLHRADPAASVALAGEFNRWSPTTTPMRYNAASGAHEACVPLPLGRCEYRLVVDGVWIADPSNPSISVNPYGETNSVVVVTQRSAALDVIEGAD